MFALVAVHLLFFNLGCTACFSSFLFASDVCVIRPIICIFLCTYCCCFVLFTLHPNRTTCPYFDNREFDIFDAVYISNTL